MTAATTKATANTTQWQAFKTSLNSKLGQSWGSYEAGSLYLIASYALGYRALKGTDYNTASKYADYALAGLHSACYDMQQVAASVDWQYIGTTDGTTSTFTLPQTPDTVAAPLHVSLSPVHTAPIVKGGTSYTAADLDYVGSFLYVIQVSKTSGGPADYTKGVDWAQETAPSDAIDWALGGTKPAQGATYYVTYASFYEANQSAYSTVTLNGNQITFTGGAPAAGQAIWAQYTYGVWSGGTTTKGYQRAGGGTGGFGSVYVDNSYPARSLGKYVALGYDWLYDYPLFDATLKARCESLMYQWYTFLRTAKASQRVPTSSYIDGPESNYGAGYYISNLLSAATLKNHGVSNGTTMWNALTATGTGFRDAKVAPELSLQTYETQYGGWWCEGLSYGQLSIENHVLAALCLQDQGLSVTTEQAWANACMLAMTHARYWKGSYTVPALSQTFDGYIYPVGDSYYYPMYYAENPYLAHLSAFCTGNAQAYAQNELHNAVTTVTDTAEELLFGDPTAVGTDPATTEPLDYYAAGQHVMFGRHAWDYASVWFVFHNVPNSWADHIGQSSGLLLIHRGADDLLCDAPSVGGYKNNWHRSTYSNLVVIDSNGASPPQDYAFSTGPFYGRSQYVQGNTGTAYVSVLAQEANPTAGYSYGSFDTKHAYDYDPGVQGPVSELQRSLVYVRSLDYFFVYDRVHTQSAVGVDAAGYQKQQSWWCRNGWTVSGNSFSCTTGTSKLYGQTYSQNTITTTNTGAVVVGSATCYKVYTNCTTAAKVRYVTALQAGSSALAAMDANSHIVSGDGQMEGILLGDWLVLFGSTPPVTTPFSYSYTGTAGHTINHVVCDLTANHTYTLSGAASGTATASSAGVLTFTTTGTGGAQSVTIT